MTRERILAAALELAGREGLQALSSRRVAAEAGLSLGLLHYHFGSMAELVEETMAAFFGELSAILGRSGIVPGAASEPSLGEEEALVAALTGMLELGSRRPGLLLAAIAGAGSELAAAEVRGELTGAGSELAAAEAGVGAAATGAPAEAQPFANLLRQLPQPGPKASRPQALELYRGLGAGVRAIVARRLGPAGAGLASERSLRLLCSVLHPILLSPLPALIFGMELRAGQAREAYVAAAVAEALRPREDNPSLSANGSA